MGPHFNDIYTIWKKEMTVWLRKPVEGIIRSCVFALIFLLVFSYAIGGDMQHLPVAVVRETSSSQVTMFLNNIEKDRALKIEVDTSYTKALSLLKSNKIYAIIHITKDFPEKVKLIMDGTSPVIRSSIEGLVKNSLNNIKGKEKKIHSDVEIDILYGHRIEYLDYLTPSAIIMSIAMTAIFAGGIGLLTDRLQGSLHATILTPITVRTIVVAKILAGVTQALTAGSFALFIAIMLGTNIKQGPAEITVMMFLMFLISFAAMGISMAIASVVENVSQFILVVQAMLLPAWVLSGALYPINSLPFYLRWIPPINPLYYTVDAFRVVMSRGVIWNSIIGNMIFLAGFSMFTVFIGTKLFRRAI